MSATDLAQMPILSQAASRTEPWSNIGTGDGCKHLRRGCPNRPVSARHEPRCVATKAEARLEVARFIEW
jgi:hypothetical protein